MRASLPATLLLSALLAACSTKGDIPPSKHIAQSGALRVHPGLLGKPVPPELQPVAPRVAAVPAVAAGEEAIKMDPVGLRTQRSVYFDLNSADIKAITTRPCAPMPATWPTIRTRACASKAMPTNAAAPNTTAALASSVPKTSVPRWSPRAPATSR